MAGNKLKFKFKLVFSFFLSEEKEKREKKIFELCLLSSKFEASQKLFWMKNLFFIFASKKKKDLQWNIKTFRPINNIMCVCVWVLLFFVFFQSFMAFSNFHFFTLSSKQQRQKPFLDAILEPFQDEERTMIGLENGKKEFQVKTSTVILFWKVSSMKISLFAVWCSGKVCFGSLSETNGLKDIQ